LNDFGALESGHDSGLNQERDMAQGFDQLVSALQVRFDFQSSRIMVREALERAGLKEQADYSPAELQKFADGLNSVATNLNAVWTKLGISPSGVPLPAPKPPPVVVKPPEPPKPEPKPEPPAPVVEAAPEPPPAPEPEPAPEPVFEAAPEPAPEPVVEAAPEPVVEAAPEEAPAEEAPSFFGKKKKKKKDEHIEAAPEGEIPADNG